jgi:hypothetical protein
MLRELKGGATDYAARQQQRRRRFMIRVAVVCLLLMLAFVIGGVIYTWFVGTNKPIVVTSLPPVQKPVVATPPKIDENAAVGVAVEAMSPPLKAGANASISVKTRQEAACSITVTYDQQKSTDAGLIPKIADEFGVVVWTWTVEVGRPAGSWPVEVTCAYGEKSGYGKEMLTITSSV